MVKLYVWGYQCYPKGANSWHGSMGASGNYSINWNFKNNTDKAIKYATFWFVPYTAAGDKVVFSKNSSSAADTESVRPLRPGERIDGCYEYAGPLYPGKTVDNCRIVDAWYNPNISTVKLSGVFIEYMDGTSEKIEASDVSFSAPKGASACYIATAVYGSYDCPQVWTLRRYRDDILAENLLGRLFIKIYYAVSPTLVKWFGNTQWFKKFWRSNLDRLVEKLRNNGVENTPYNDKIW